MRVDLKAAREELGDLLSEELKEKLKKIEDLEKYTLLRPPYTKDAVKKLIETTEKELNYKFSKDCFILLNIFDGGYLFTDTFYSLLIDDNELEIVENNKYFHEINAIPKEAMAIGETNYGAYFVEKKSGENEFGIWDPEKGEYIADFNGLNEMFDYIINEAEYLLKDNCLPLIEDPDDDTEDEEK